MSMINTCKCRKCGTVNPWVYLAPVPQVDDDQTSVICFDCAIARGWIDRDGNMQPGIEL